MQIPSAFIYQIGFYGKAKNTLVVRPNMLGSTESCPNALKKRRRRAGLCPYCSNILIVSHTKGVIKKNLGKRRIVLVLSIDRGLLTPKTGGS